MTPSFATSDALARLASRMDAVKPSPILAMTRRAAEMRRTGIDVIDLGIGEPDFDTSGHVKDAGIKAIRDGLTKYTPSTGLAALVEAIGLKFRRDNGLDYAPDEITIGTGGKQVIYNAIMATVEAGDEVVVPTPYWTSYPDIVRLAGGRPVFVPCDVETGFQPDLQALEAAITPRTRWLLLNSPSNPSGGVLTRRTLEAVARILRRNAHVLIMSDDMYEHFVFDDGEGGNRFFNILDLAPDLRDRTLIVNGISKTYAMTGWRLGFAAGPKRLIGAMTTLQGHSTTHPTSISQAAAIAALTGPQEEVAERGAAFRRRGKSLREGLDTVPGLACATSAGAFYLYPSCAGLIGARTTQGKVLVSDEDVATFLLETARVCVVHGAAFGLSPHLRFSYAASDAALDRAVVQIKAAVATLDRSARTHGSGASRAAGLR